jgi:phosphate transport system protein
MTQPFTRTHCRQLEATALTLEFGDGTVSEHMMKSFEEELVRLKGMVTNMGELTGAQLRAAIGCTEAPDSELANSVIQREPEANRMMHQIDNLVIRVLALRQPMAIDLREVLSALRIAIELERICDHAEDLAQRVITIRAARVEPVHSLVNLGRFAMEMVNDAMHAYTQRDEFEAQQVWTRDTELDAMYTALFRERLTYMLEDPHEISANTQMLFMARAIERIGDRATNISETVRYLVGGIPVEEERPKADATKSILLSTTSSQ